jgi:hypothetical protein
MCLRTIAYAAACAAVAVASPTLPADFGWSEVSSSSSLHPLGYTVHHTTYLSPVMKLKPGQVVFTNPKQTPLKMPAGGSAFVGFTGEVVDARNASVPLSFVYDPQEVRLRQSLTYIDCLLEAPIAIAQLRGRKRWTTLSAAVVQERLTP